MVAMVVWHGTTAEGTELVSALGANCDCKYGPMGIRLSTCAAHEAFARDQRFLDGLLISRRRRAALIKEEMSR